MTFDAKQFLSSVSSSPGVYRMLDEEQNTLYVGKAKRLKARPSCSSLTATPTLPLSTSAHVSGVTMAAI